MKDFFKKHLSTIIEVLQCKEAKRYYWNTFNGALGLAIIAFTNMDFVYAPLVIAFLNGITKEINTRYL